MLAVYTIPTFNLTCNLWTGGNPVGPPRLSPVCNLAWGRRVNVASTGGTTTLGIPLVTMSLLLPALTDVRGPFGPSGEDACEVPAGSGRLYHVVWVDDIGKGFANEHRCAVLEMYSVPEPMP